MPVKAKVAKLSEQPNCESSSDDDEFEMKLKRKRQTFPKVPDSILNPMIHQRQNHSMEKGTTLSMRIAKEIKSKILALKNHSSFLEESSISQQSCNSLATPTKRIYDTFEHQRTPTIQSPFSAAKVFSNALQSQLKLKQEIKSVH